MAAQDATMFWLSRRSRNDLFLLYAFADLGHPTAELRAAIRTRGAAVPDLCVRLREVPGELAYPSWVPCEILDDQFVEHPGITDWAGVRSAMGELLGTGVDATRRPWRLHVFRGIADAPMRRSPEEMTTVAVLQMSHALVDGRRATAVARELFGGAPESGSTSAPRRADPVGARSARRRACAETRDRVDSRGRKSRPASQALSAIRGVPAGRGVAPGLCTHPWPDRLAAAVGALLLPVGVARTFYHGFRSHRARQQLAALTEAGRVPPPGPGFAPTAVNDGSAPPVSAHAVDMLVFDSDDLRVPGYTVTVVVLTAVSIALPTYLAAEGTPATGLGAQVPMALPDGGKGAARNNYRNLSIDLCLDEPDLPARAGKIATSLRARSERARHPLLAAQDRVTAVTPALFLRRDADGWPLDTVPDVIAGNTVVSSVNRGPADLVFGGPARFSAGFPAVGSVMRLTHGVHGLGETVTISLHADPVVVPDLAVYAGYLRNALNQVVAELR